MPNNKKEHNKIGGRINHGDGADGERNKELVPKISTAVMHMEVE